ncbi:hypothetical protein [Streptomyces sp. ISL-94]|nr:hypothetical protein [Streptomyces sp. ISL-94]
MIFVVMFALSAKRRRDEHESAQAGTGQAQKGLEATAVPVG